MADFRFRYVHSFEPSDTGVPGNFYFYWLLLDYDWMEVNSQIEDKVVKVLLLNAVVQPN